MADTKRACRIASTVQGRVDLDAAVLTRAHSLACEFYEQQEARDFSGDDVEALALPEWVPPRASWFPTEQLRSMGLHAHPKPRGEELVMTLGVDLHVDDIHGQVLLLVLANEGLTFRQGRVRHATRPGEWFVFDDRKPHAVREARSRAGLFGMGSAPACCWEQVMPTSTGLALAAFCSKLGSKVRCTRAEDLLRPLAGSRCSQCSM